MIEIPSKIREAYRDLPSGWKLEKLKFFAVVRNSNVDKAISEDEKLVRLCNYTDVYYNDRITPGLQFLVGSATEAEIERFQLKQDQVIITKDSEGWDDIGVPAFVTEDMPDVLCGYHLSVIEPGPKLNGGFLAWLCRAEPLNAQFKLAANGVTRFGLGQYPMKNAFIALPPLDAQRRIARFLDEKTARIDSLIEKKRELVDRLAEKRQALIARTVTKGLNPDAQLKPSEIDTQKEPHRATVGADGIRLSSGAIRYFAHIRNGTTPGSGEAEYWDGDVLWATPEDLGKLSGDTISQTKRQVTDSAVKESNLSVVPPGSVIVSTRAPIGHMAINDVPMAFNQGCRGIIPGDRVHGPFLYYTLKSRILELNAMANGTTFVELSRNGLAALRIELPPLDTQRRIAMFLNEKTAQIDGLIERIEDSIERLYEYRSAQVTAAVTGQPAELA